MKKFWMFIEIGETSYLCVFGDVKYDSKVKISKYS